MKTEGLTPQQKADLYIALRAQIAELCKEARELGKEFPDGRTEGTFKDIRVAMQSPGWRAAYKTKGGRKVYIVDKLKPKKPKKGEPV